MPLLPSSLSAPSEKEKWQFLAEVHLAFENLQGGSEIKRVKANAGKPNNPWKTK